MKQTTYILLLGDFINAIIALAAAEVIRFGASENLARLFSERLPTLVVVISVILFSSYFSELYDRERFLSRIELLLRIAVVLILSFFILTVIFYLVPSLMLGRGLLLAGLLVFGLLQYLHHRVIQLSRLFPLLAKRVMILGVGPLAESMAQLIHSGTSNYTFAGFINPLNELALAGEGQVVGTLDQFSEAIKRAKAQKLVVSLTERRGIMPVKDILSCKLGGLEVVDAVSFYEQMTGKLLIENIQPSWFIYSNGFRVTSLMRIQKRIFDIVFSAIGLLCAAPIFPLVAMVVKFDSPGPVFFRQVRIGAGEKEFQVLKFRTMRQDAEKDTGAVWAQQNDPRITRCGQFLRKSRLDEIPQLINVLCGDMSFVGPRPERPEFVQKLTEIIPYYSKRHFVKPGVTGWAQVKYPYGASVEDSLEKLRYDLYYIKNYSLLLDFQILLETIKVVLFSRGSR
jgi:sugar transferase (PEP-CTERM system associated)